jgi:hypothetical protein
MVPSLSTILRRAAAVAAVGTAAVTLCSCTPDTTRERVQDDVAATFANSYETSLSLQGKTVQAPEMTSTECHSSVNKVADSGPGSWGCELKYVDPRGKRHDDFFVVLIDSLACYQAFNGDNRDATIVDKATGATLPDPKVGFDGCYDVYDGRTSTSKK